MAEFVHVMEDWRRMCRSMDGNDPYEKCDKCPLGEEHVCTFEISDIQDDELQRVEEKVAAWVKAHPEPQYPTWGEWLCEQGVVIISPSPRYEEDFERLHYLTPVVRDPIPADLAEKLGLQPKEGT